MRTKKTQKGALLLYAFLAMPLAFAGLPLYIHAPDFYTRELGLSIGTIGALLLAIRLFDAIQDPLIGFLSDRYAHKRTHIIALGILMLIIGMGGVFSGPLLPIPLGAWFALTMVLATTGFSIVAINMNMIGGLWSDDKNERTRISGWREAFALLGLLLGSILPAILILKTAPATGYSYTVLTFTALCIIGAILFLKLLSTINANTRFKPKKKSDHFALFRILLGSNRRFFLGCCLTHIAASLPGVLVLFFIRDYLDAHDYTGLFLALYFLSGAALMPLWTRIAKIIGKHETWIASMILAILTFIWAYLLTPGDIIAFSIICILSGTALGADLALPPSIMADRINRDQGEQNATQYYAALALIPKTALALISAIAFMALDNAGFSAGAQNTDTALQTLIILYALIPCGFKLLSAAIIWKDRKSL